MEQINGIEASADGKRNAYNFPCPVMGYRSNFAVCLNLIAKRKEGRLQAIYADCSAAIGNKRCPALGMRKEELEKGQAIYFEERRRSGPTGSGGIQTVWTGNDKSRVTIQLNPPTKPADTPKRKGDALVDGGGVADAITNAFEEEKKRAEALKKESVETGRPVIAAVQQPQGVTPLPGESLLDMARRIMKLNQGANT